MRTPRAAAAAFCRRQEAVNDEWVRGVDEVLASPLGARMRTTSGILMRDRVTWAVRRDRWNRWARRLEGKR